MNLDNELFLDIVGREWFNVSLSGFFALLFIFFLKNIWGIIGVTVTTKLLKWLNARRGRI